MGEAKRSSLLSWPWGEGCSFPGGRSCVKGRELQGKQKEGKIAKILGTNCRFRAFLTIYPLSPKTGGCSAPTSTRPQRKGRAALGWVSPAGVWVSFRTPEGSRPQEAASAEITDRRPRSPAVMRSGRGGRSSALAVGEERGFEKNYGNQSRPLPASVRLFFWAKLIGLRKDLMVMTIWSAQQEIL